MFQFCEIPKTQYITHFPFGTLEIHGVWPGWVVCVVCMVVAKVPSKVLAKVFAESHCVVV